MRDQFLQTFHAKQGFLRSQLYTTVVLRKKGSISYELYIKLYIYIYNSTYIKLYTLWLFHLAMGSSFMDHGDVGDVPMTKAGCFQIGSLPPGCY